MTHAALHNLLIYGDGGHCAMHHDSEKCPGMFGTLVLVLPSCQQGDLLGGQLWYEPVRCVWSSSAYLNGYKSEQQHISCCFTEVFECFQLMALEWQYQLPSKRTYAERSTAAYDLSGFNKGSLHIQVTCGQIIAVVDTAAAAVAAVVAVAIAVAAADVAVDAVAVWCCCNESLTALKKGLVNVM